MTIYLARCRICLDARAETATQGFVSGQNDKQRLLPHISLTQALLVPPCPEFCRQRASPAVLTSFHAPSLCSPFLVSLSEPEQLEVSGGLVPGLETNSWPRGPREALGRRKWCGHWRDCFVLVVADLPGAVARDVLFSGSHLVCEVCHGASRHPLQPNRARHLLAATCWGRSLAGRSQVVAQRLVMSIGERTASRRTARP